MPNLSRTIATLSVTILLSGIFQSVQAQRTFDTNAAAQGQRGRTSSPTGSGLQGMGANVRSNVTGKQVPRYLPAAGFGSIAGRQFGLPQTNLDSFVAQAQGNAELIYGDEGEDGPPPYEYFTEEHRIEAGINNSQLTTGHASDLPEAWGWPD
jgi:hypothetical protein